MSGNLSPVLEIRSNLLRFVDKYSVLDLFFLIFYVKIKQN